MKAYIKETINFYDQNVEEYIQKTIKLQDDEWLNKFSAHLPEKAKVLDVGCGFGRDTNLFTLKKYDAYGIDLSLRMIEKAKDFSPASKFQVMDMLKLEFEAGYFDGIWCSAALLHLSKEDAKGAIGEIKRVLKKNGLLYLNLKEGEGEKHIIDERYKNAKKFYAYYTEDEIKALLSGFGFEIVDFKLERNPQEEYKNTGIIFLIAKNKL